MNFENIGNNIFSWSLHFLNSVPSVSDLYFQKRQSRTCLEFSSNAPIWVGGGGAGERKKYGKLELRK